jgi:RNA polymerase sigma-70 factor (ECF subfamily)
MSDPGDSVSAANSSPLPELTHSMELVHRVRDGDDGALNELLERYRPRLERIVRIRMGARLRRFLEPDDLVQETFVVALRKLGDIELRTHASIIQWLAAVAENQIHDKLDYFGAQKRDDAREVPLEVKRPGGEGVRRRDLADLGTSPSLAAQRNEIADVVDACVKELQPDAYREVVLLRDYYDADWETVCEKLDRPTIGAAQELYRRAQIRLARHLKERFEE